MKKYMNSPDAAPKISAEAYALIDVAVRVNGSLSLLLKTGLHLKKNEPDLVASVRRRVEALLALLK